MYIYSTWETFLHKFQCGNIHDQLVNMMLMKKRNSQPPEIILKKTKRNKLTGLEYSDNDVNPLIKLEHLKCLDL